MSALEYLDISGNTEPFVNSAANIVIKSIESLLWEIFKKYLEHKNLSVNKFSTLPDITSSKNSHIYKEIIFKKFLPLQIENREEYKEKLVNNILANITTEIRAGIPSHLNYLIIDSLKYIEIILKNLGKDLSYLSSNLRDTGNCMVLTKNYIKLAKKTLSNFSDKYLNKFDNFIDYTQEVADIF